MNTLSPRMLSFIDHVLAGLPHGRAAQEAGYCPGSDDNAARSYGAQLYAKLLPEIESRRLKAVVASTAAIDLSIHRTLLETYHHAHYDPRQVVAWGPEGLTVRASAELTPEQARLVKAVRCDVVERIGKDGTTTRTTRTRVELVDRQTALHRLAEYQGLTAGDPNLGMRVPGAAAANAAEDAQAATAKLAEEIRDVPTDELIRRWKESRAVTTKQSDRLPVPA